MTALEQSDRVCFIGLTVSTSLLNKLSTVSEPFSELEELVLLSQDSMQLAPTSAFRWGHRLRTLRSTRIAIPSLPRLLSPSHDLIDLQLNEIPGVGYFSPEAFANALGGMTQLETLSLHFLSFPPRRNYLRLPPPPGDRVILPALTRFRYRGVSKYLDNLVARIDAPRLGDIDVTFFNQPTLDASQLGLFINRTEMRKSPLQAEIVFYEDSISITFTQPGTSTRLGLQISCEQLDWQLFSISQICDHFSSFLFNVEDLGIMTIGPSSVPDDVDDDQWQGLIRVFDRAKDFRVVGEFATEIMHAFSADEEHETALPSLRNLHVQPMHMHGPLKDFVESFVTRRRLSSHPVQINSPYIGRPTAEEVESAKRQVQVQKRSAFNRFKRVVGRPPIPDSAIHEYIRNLEYLDIVLCNIERYIHIAFGALKDEDVVRRMFTMMAPTKFQLEESKKPKPRYVLEPRAIRGMIQEADNMDQRLMAVLGVRSAVPHQPQQPPRPTPSFKQHAPAAAPLVTIDGPSPPPTIPFQPGH
ncbi:hypothetical protein EDB84DRAFT_1563086 [Lactarius hengduanensis]|nr:hypothetical protein EDB84DRAFT_1563086 [Lactarius hengduanensis]